MLGDSPDAESSSSETQGYSRLNVVEGGGDEHPASPTCQASRVETLRKVSASRPGTLLANTNWLPTPLPDQGSRVPFMRNQVGLMDLELSCIKDQDRLHRRVSSIRASPTGWHQQMGLIMYSRGQANTTKTSFRIKVRYA